MKTIIFILALVFVKAAVASEELSVSTSRLLNQEMTNELFYAGIHQGWSVVAGTLKCDKGACFLSDYEDTQQIRSVPKSLAKKLIPRLAKLNRGSKQKNIATVRCYDPQGTDVPADHLYCDLQKMIARD